MRRAHRHARAREHARRWRRSPAVEVVCRKETTAATARILDSTAGGTGQTTSSRRDRLFFRSLLAQDRPRTRRQAENADESGSVLLVVALAHGERRQVGAIKRVLRLATRDRDVAFVEAQT